MTKAEANALKRKIADELELYSYKDGYKVIQVVDIIRAVAIVLDREIEEDKVCENCKFYGKDFVCNKIPQHDTDILDSNGRSVPDAEFIPMDGFGCNIFERKDNEPN